MMCVCDGCALHVHICGLCGVGNVYVCIGHVCVWCVCPKCAYVSAPASRAPGGPLPAAAGLRPGPRGVGPSAPRRPFRYTGHVGGPWRGLGGRPLLGGGGGICPDEPRSCTGLCSACVLQARPLCFLPAGTQRGAHSVLAGAWCLSSKDPSCQGRRRERRQFDPWAGKIPCRRAWQTHSTVVAWRIPWTEEPAGLQLMESQKSLTWLRN